MELAEVIANVDAGRIPASIYSDPEIFALERERLFPRTWQFLAHESEIPEPGDYVVRRIVDDSFIVSRDRDVTRSTCCSTCAGTRACRCAAPRPATHRTSGARTTRGRTAATAGWSVCRSTKRPTAATPGSTRRRTRCSRRRTSRRTAGSCSPTSIREAAPLEDALGDFRFFLDLYVNQSDGGVELRGPQRWRIACNWKIGAENFAGDSYHTPHTHASVVDIGLFREPTANKRKEGALYFAGGGGGTTYKIPPGDFDHAIAHVGYPPEMAERMRATWTPEQQALVGEAGFMVSAATVFPNLSFVHNWPRIRPGDDVVPFISIRLWQPVSATETECLSWFAVDRNAPAGVQGRFLQGVPDVLRHVGDVRAGRRRELDVDHEREPRRDGVERCCSTRRWGWTASTTGRHPGRRRGPHRARRTSATASTTSAPCCACGRVRCEHGDTDLDRRPAPLRVAAVSP